jgi:mannosylglycoprotein endo-beta-mannosidase
MILIQNSEEGLRNLKFILLCFGLLSGLKINFHKSEVIVMGVEAEEQARVARLLNCKQGRFPFTYLGFSMSDHKLSIADMEPLVATVGKRAAPWQGRFMSSAARLTLIDACLSNLPLHSMARMKVLTSTETGSSGRAREPKRSSIG